MAQSQLFVYKKDIMHLQPLYYIVGEYECMCQAETLACNWMGTILDPSAGLCWNCTGAGP